MVRRNAPPRRSLIYWFGAPIAIVTMVACSGYMTSDNYFDAPMCPSDEDGYLSIPKECCPCPWPDMCPDGWPEVPAKCRTGCEPGQPIECCECPTEAWCSQEAAQHFKEPEWCKSKPWRDGGADGSSATCPVGICVPKTPEGWLWPATLYEGFDIGMDACPEGSTTWDGIAEPAPPGCAECACSTPRSICGSSPQWTISSRACTDFDNGVKWNFDPPPNWDGSCDSDKSIPAGKLCGTDGYCAKSIKISPPQLELIDTTCTPSVKVQDELPVPKLHAGSLTPVARVCIDKRTPSNLPTCGVDDKDVCVSIPGPGPACIAKKGALDCPAGWPDQHVFYENIDDKRTCSECSCGPATGASCKRKYTLYKDNACTTEYGHWLSEDTDLPQCLWLIDGTAVGSKTLETVEHNLGACEPSGGEVIGDLKLNDPFTVCCVATDM